MQLYPEFGNDTDFIETLLAEQSVFCLPGKCFGVQNLMRIVLTLPHDLNHEAMNRIELFCREHMRLPVSPLVVVNQDKENSSLTAATKVPFKKISSAGVNPMLSSNLANLFAADPEEAQILMQAYQK